MDAVSPTPRGCTPRHGRTCSTRSCRTERRRGGVDPVEDYRRYVDGRSRDDGVRAVLSARYLALPQGAPDDPPRRRTVHGLAARKQELFAARLAGGGVRAFPSTVTLLRRLRGGGVRTRLVTASRNSAGVLSAAAVVLDLLDVRVDGDDVSCGSGRRWAHHPGHRAAAGVPGRSSPRRTAGHVRGG